MTLEPQWISAIVAVCSLMLIWTTTVIGGVAWLMRRLDAIKHEILADIKVKHEEHTEKVEALRTLVIRHDTILDPEFNGVGKARARQ